MPALRIGGLGFGIQIKVEGGGCRVQGVECSVGCRACRRLQECTDDEVTVDDFIEVGPRLMLLTVQVHPAVDQRHLPEETRGVLQVCDFVHDRNHLQPRLKLRPVNSLSLLP